VSQRSLRFTWAWLWSALAALLLLVGGGFITVIALSGHSQGEVALAILLIGLPALLGVLALGTMALIMARPSGNRWRVIRRWGLALVGGTALLIGVITLGTGSGGFALIVAGACALAFLVLDLRRGRDGE
jgi:peptidoglycan/LPS O-acetylase OafA/YrhL